MPLKNSGIHIGNTTASWSNFLASTKSAISYLKEKILYQPTPSITYPVLYHHPENHHQHWCLCLSFLGPWRIHNHPGYIEHTFVSSYSSNGFQFNSWWHRSPSFTLCCQASVKFVMWYDLSQGLHTSLTKKLGTKNVSRLGMFAYTTLIEHALIQKPLLLISPKTLHTL